MMIEDKHQQTASQLSNLFTAMADKTRAHILLHLREGEMRSSDIATALDMTASAVSHQLRWLRDHHVVAQRKAGREVYYHLADDCIAEIITVALGHIGEGVHKV